MQLLGLGDVQTLISAALPGLTLTKPIMKLQEPCVAPCQQTSCGWGTTAAASWGYTRSEGAGQGQGRGSAAQDARSLRALPRLYRPNRPPQGTATPHLPHSERTKWRPPRLAPSGAARQGSASRQSGRSARPPRAIG